MKQQKYKLTVYFELEDRACYEAARKFLHDQLRELGDKTFFLRDKSSRACIDYIAIEKAEK